MTWESGLVVRELAELNLQNPDSPKVQLLLGGVRQAAGQRGLLGPSCTTGQSASQPAPQAEVPSEQMPWGGGLHAERQFKSSSVDLFCLSIYDAKKVTKCYLQQTFQSEHATHSKFTLFLR